MGVWEFLGSSTPGGVVGSAAKGLAEGIFDGVERIARVWNMPPEAAAELEKFKTEAMNKADEITASDTANARQREIALADNTTKILAYIITIGFFGILAYMLHDPLPANSAGHDVLLVMLGALGTAWAGVVSYYFGASKTRSSGGLVHPPPSS